MTQHWRNSYDTWLTRSPEMPSVGRRERERHHAKYACVNCPWRGWNALDHHRDPLGTGKPLADTKKHHRIRILNAPDEWPDVMFGCCVKPDQPRVAERPDRELSEVEQ